MLKNFLFSLGGCRPTYTPQCRQAAAIHHIHQVVGDEVPILVLASGGVDSTVVCALLSKALSADRIVVLHVNTGFMRHDESESVLATLKALGIHVEYVDAAETFAKATTTVAGVESAPLHSVHEPELKRIIIGDCFMAVCDDVIRRLGLDEDRCILAQGSLRPDLIESGSPSIGKAADVIKTHHNDTAIVRELRRRGRIIEPLSDYHKDEVRALGTDLGLPDTIVWRQPFPGPGLAIRIICAHEPFLPNNHETVQTLLHTFSKDRMKVHLLPIRTVGVQGDGRSYASLGGITTTSVRPDWNQLIALARAIPKQVHCINRVVFVFPSRSGLSHNDKESPLPLSVTPTSLEAPEITLLRTADRIVNEILLANKLGRVLAQVPVILFPVDAGETGKRCIALRPFVTYDFMTGTPAIPGLHLPETVLKEMVDRILGEMPDISRVCYDLTAKPPGTTEWE